MKKQILDPGEYKGTYKLIGGQLCFDFTNTVSWRGLENIHEWLDNFENLATWAQMVQILNSKEVESLKSELLHPIEQGDKNLNQLKKIRESIYNIFDSIINEVTPTELDMKILNTNAKKAMSQLELIPSANQYMQVWKQDLSALDKIQHSVVRSAIHVLTNEDLARVKKCPSCRWLYSDMSKNKSRRWCTMEDCGNRNKVNAFLKNRKQ